MKKLFSIFAALLMAATMFAGRTFSAGDKLYMNCSAVGWWCNDGVSQTMYFADASDATTPVVGTEYGEAGSKIYEFACPAGTFEYIYEQRGTWNTTGHISLTGTEAYNYIKSFTENGTTVTWGNLGDAPDPDETYYLYVTDGSAHWDKLYVYAWGGKELFGAWPGMDVRTAPQENGKYKLTMTGQKGSSVNLIFHNNNGSQYNSDSFTLTGDHSVTTLDPDAPAIPGGVALWPQNAVLATAIPSSVRVLSLNNSLIHYGSEFQDVMFNDMAKAMGEDALWTEHTNLGKTLKFHFEEDPLNPTAQQLMASVPYTHIILQEQTKKPRENFADYRASVIRWVEYIRTYGANPNAVIILPINWAFNNSSSFAADNAEFKKLHSDLAQELGLVLAPVGVAYDLAAAAEGMSIMAEGGNWFKDDRHPTQMTTYLGACIEYGVIFGVDPLTITWKPSTITPEQAQQMRQYAHDAIAATPQTIDHRNHTIRFEVRQLDVNGYSIGTLEAAYSGDQLTDNIFTATAAGSYSVAAVYGSENLSATVTVAAMQTAPVVETPAIAVTATNNVVAEDFNSLPAADGTADAKGALYPENNTLPLGWRIERNQVGPRTIGIYSSAATTLQYAGGANLPGNAYNGTWNLGANGSSDRAVGGMTTGVANGARTINVMAHLANEGTKDFTSVAISYDIEKYREGSNVNLFYVKLFTSRNGSVWTEAGETFTYMNPKGSGQTGFAVVPGATNHVEGSLNLNFAAGTDLYLCWSISTSAGDDCASAPCLAIDNVNLAFSDGTQPEVEPEYAGIEFSESAATYTQDFNALPYPAAGASPISGLNGVYGMGSTLPLGWRAERNESGPRKIGSYANAIDTLQYQGGVSLPGNAKNGTWNLGMNGSTDRAIGGMTTDAAGGARTINIMAFIKNVGAKAITSINLSYNVEKYRDGSNTNEFYVKLFVSEDGQNWTDVKNADFDFINPKAGAQNGFAEVPAASTPISGTLDETIAAGGWLHLCWSIATSAGTVCQAAPCLAIDDVNIKVTYETTTGMENSVVNAVTKRLVNGQLYIIRSNEMYTLQGVRVQ